MFVAIATVNSEHVRMSETPESPSTPFGAYRTFAEMVDDLARVKGFHQHKQLAKAVSDNTKMTVLERNVSNWRRGVSLPSGPFMKPLADALGVTGHPTLEPLWHRLHGEALAARKLLPPEDDSEAQDPENAKRFAFAPWMKWAGGAVAVLVVTGGLAATGMISTKPAVETYVKTIPPYELRLSRDGFVLPQSSVRELTLDDIRHLTGWELYVARNEIYARHGRMFTRAYSVCIQNHFDSWARTTANPRGWYAPVSGEVRPSELEIKNALLIEKFECEDRKGQFICNGRPNACKAPRPPG